MTYPKTVMKNTDLENIGLPEDFIIYAYRRKGQTYAWQMNPTKKNSPILFDTGAFEKWRVQMASRKTVAI